MLELRGVSKSYDIGGHAQKVLKTISINFRTSEFAAILGPSGSGKTTLLNIIGGLDQYTSGDIKINEISTKKFKDKDWDAYRNHRIGFVFQSYNLIPHQTVLQNVKLALTLSGISKREANKRATKALEEVGLKDHINKRPNQLSGGQMQRVAIARALVNNPDILLADEPTGALDSDTSVQIMDLLKRIAETKLVVMVTHNPELADQYATRIITLKDGKITSDSNPYDGKVKTNQNEEEVARKQKKTKMSFFTALSLSLKNLLTKKARTALVAVAGSIGIIGIALILAVSTGFQSYIDTIEEDTLTSYPLMIQREAADLTSVLLNNMLGSEGAENDGLVHENQVLTSTLGNVTTNDLKSFREYLNNHYSEVKDDIRLIENEYSVDPLIYTIDATGALAQLNPNNLFSSVLGGSQLISSYTSVFAQYERENMENDFRVLAGRLPEAYDELIIVLSAEGRMGDLLTYSLGLHDTSELSTIISKLMAGETVEINNEPLVMSYDELMDVKLKLLYATDLYKYNSTYNIYEDMRDNDAYMRDLYNRAEELKIVGVATPRDDLMTVSGVAYLPSLVTHIIEKSSATEIVKKQIAEPDVDIFSGVKFGDESSNFDFAFSDLVSVDSNKIASAFNVTIDQNAVAAKTQEYIAEISNDITADIAPAQTALSEKFTSLADGFVSTVVGEVPTSSLTELAMNYVDTQDFSDLSNKYLMPSEQFAALYGGLLTGATQGYVAAYCAMNAAACALNPDDPAVTMVPMIWASVVENIASSDEVIATFKSLAITLTEIVMKSEILTKVGELTSYLSSSFADAFSIDESALLSAFTLNFSQDELTRIVQAMFTKTESTYSGNLNSLGYQNLDEPTYISVYFASFEGKTHFMEFIDSYNEKMQNLGAEDKVIEYSDTTGMLMNSVKVIVDAVSYVLIAFVSISLVVSSIMIGVITYISVYERIKEIGILRAIGASKRNISNIFNAETFIVGLLSGIFGIVVSYIFIPIINLVLHHFTGDIPLSAQLYPNGAVILIVLSVILTLIGGLIPARAAAKKDPVEALRSE